MAEASIDLVAAELVRLHADGSTVAPFSARYPELTPEDGYRAAARLHAHRVAQGWKPVGRKIGFTNRTIWKRYGVYEPMWGMVYDRTLQFARDGRARVALAEYVALRRQQPHFANARSVRNALDRARLRQASRLFAQPERALGRDDLCTIEVADLRASRVFASAKA